MHDPKLDKWFSVVYGPAEFKMIGGVADDTLRAMYASYLWNIQSADKVPKLARWLFTEGWVRSRIDRSIRIRMLGEDRLGTPEEEVAIANEFARVFEKESHETFPNPHAGFETIDYSDRLAHNLADVFPSQVVAAWTAFEVLCGDVWVWAVNKWPQFTASLSGRENRIERASTHGISSDSESSGDSLPTQKGKDIPLNVIHAITGGRFDLSNLMGHALVESRKVSFTTLRDIRRAYILNVLDSDTSWP